MSGSTLPIPAIPAERAAKNYTVALRARGSESMTGADSATEPDIGQIEDEWNHQ